MRQSEEETKSVMTVDRLRLFNEAQGTVAGNATDELEAIERVFAEGEAVEGQPAEEGDAQEAAY